MEAQIYKIDQTQLNKLRNKTILRGLIIIIPSLLIITAIQYLQDGNRSLMPSFLTYCIMIPIVLIPIYIGANKAKKSYSTMEIVLSTNGIERRAEAWPFRRISWTNAVITKKPDGTIVINDKTVSKFSRWMYGAGRLFIQPEIVDYTKLETELYRRSTGSQSYEHYTGIGK